MSTTRHGIFKKDQPKSKSSNNSIADSHEPAEIMLILDHYHDIKNNFNKEMNAHKSNMEKGIATCKKSLEGLYRSFDRREDDPIDLLRYAAEAIEIEVGVYQTEVKEVNKIIKR